MKALEIVKSTQGLPHGLKDKIDTMLPATSPVDHLANLLNLIHAEAKTIKQQELKLAAERKFLEQLVDMAEKSVLDEMVEQTTTELLGSLVKYTIKQNPHKLIIDDESLIPDQYKQEIISVQLRKDAIKDELKMGNKIPGCQIVQDISLQLKTNKG